MLEPYDARLLTNFELGVIRVTLIDTDRTRDKNYRFQDCFISTKAVKEAHLNFVISKLERLPFTDARRAEVIEQAHLEFAQYQPNSKG